MQLQLSIPAEKSLKNHLWSGPSPANTFPISNNWLGFNDRIVKRNLNSLKMLVGTIQSAENSLKNHKFLVHHQSIHFEQENQCWGNCVCNVAVTHVKKIVLKSTQSPTKPTDWWSKLDHILVCAIPLLDLQKNHQNICCDQIQSLTNTFPRKN